ncbi:hypothetical protein ACFYXF_00820 [Streptomyces sp. NPDC002680]|uniref:hypothetical protein n=1 Tax=Streptomyces sp. NPDC002680 TaxID=3364659 RepID=UPI00369F9C1C
MQRTRWLKGYLLTALVYTRRPVAALRQFGAPGMLSLLGIVLGIPVIFMFWPCAFLLAPVAAAGPQMDCGLTAQTAAVSATAMWISAAIMAGAMLVAAYKRRMSWWTAALVPLYWLLHAFAGWCAPHQLVRAPYK